MGLAADVASHQRAACSEAQVVERKPPGRRPALRDELIDELRERRAAVRHARSRPDHRIEGRRIAIVADHDLEDAQRLLKRGGLISNPPS